MKAGQRIGVGNAVAVYEKVLTMLDKLPNGDRL